MSDIPENVRDWEAKHPSVEQLRKECDRLKAELGAWHSRFGSQLSHAVEEKERLKSENARLAAALRFVADECDWEKCGDGGDERIGLACWKALDGSSACLRGLLTPTIEVLEQLTYPAVSALNNDLVHRELERLRSLTASGAGDCAGG